MVALFSQFIFLSLTHPSDCPLNGQYVDNDAVVLCWQLNADFGVNAKHKMDNIYYFPVRYEVEQQNTM